MHDGVRETPGLRQHMIGIETNSADLRTVETRLVVVAG